MQPSPLAGRVKALGWEKLDAPVEHLSEAITATLAALSVPFDSSCILCSLYVASRGWRHSRLTCVFPSKYSSRMATRESMTSGFDARKAGSGGSKPSTLLFVRNSRLASAWPMRGSSPCIHRCSTSACRNVPCRATHGASAISPAVAFQLDRIICRAGIWPLPLPGAGSTLCATTARSQRPH